MPELPDGASAVIVAYPDRTEVSECTGTPTLVAFLRALADQLQAADDAGELQAADDDE